MFLGQVYGLCDICRCFGTFLGLATSIFLRADVSASTHAHILFFLVGTLKDKDVSDL